MQATDEIGPVAVPWWRFLLMTALITGLYFAVRSTVTPPRTHPALLLPTTFLGAVLGILVAKWEMTATGTAVGLVAGTAALLPRHAAICSVLLAEGSSLPKYFLSRLLNGWLSA